MRGIVFLYVLACLEAGGVAELLERGGEVEGVGGGMTALLATASGQLKKQAIEQKRKSAETAASIQTTLVVHVGTHSCKTLLQILLHRLLRGPKQNEPRQTSAIPTSLDVRPSIILAHRSVMIAAFG